MKNNLNEEYSVFPPFQYPHESIGNAGLGHRCTTLQLREVNLMLRLTYKVCNVYIWHAWRLLRRVAFRRWRLRGLCHDFVRVVTIRGCEGLPSLTSVFIGCAFLCCATLLPGLAVWPTHSSGRSNNSQWRVVGATNGNRLHTTLLLLTDFVRGINRVDVSWNRRFRQKWKSNPYPKLSSFNVGPLSTKQGLHKAISIVIWVYRWLLLSVLGLFCLKVAV